MEKKILIAVPTFENIKPECFKSIYGLTRPEGYSLYFDYVSGYDCAKARNQIAKNSMAGTYDYVLMVDSDIQLPKDTLVRLWNVNLILFLDGTTGKEQKPIKK